MPVAVNVHVPGRTVTDIAPETLGRVATLPAQTRMGPVELTVSDLDGTLAAVAARGFTAVEPYDFVRRAEPLAAAALAEVEAEWTAPLGPDRGARLREIHTDLRAITDRARKTDVDLPLLDAARAVAPAASAHRCSTRVIAGSSRSAMEKPFLMRCRRSVVRSVSDMSAVSWSA